MAFKLSDQVRAVLQHYKNPDPTGFPGAPVPDPMPIPDMDKSFGVAKMNFKNVMVYGLSKFRIDQVNTDLEKMEVRSAFEVLLTMKTILTSFLY